MGTLQWNKEHEIKFRLTKPNGGFLKKKAKAIILR